MIDSKLLLRASAALAAGGLSWLAKMAVLTATDGGDSAAASVFYLLGVALMTAGLAGIGVALTARWAVPVRALGAAAGLPAFFIAFIAIESIAKPLVGDAGPSWLGDEAGILATGAVLMTAGLLTARHAGSGPDGQAGSSSGRSTARRIGLPS